MDWESSGDGEGKHRIELRLDATSLVQWGGEAEFDRFGIRGLIFGRDRCDIDGGGNSQPFDAGCRAVPRKVPIDGYESLE